MKLVKQLRAIEALVMMNGFKPIVRSPLWLIVQLSFPLTLVFFISLYASGEAVSEALVGALISMIVMSGLALQGDVVWLRVELKFQDMVVASSVSPVSYMLGLALSELAYSSPAIVFLIVLITLRGLIRLESIPMLFFSLFLCWVLAVSLGFYLSIRITDMRHVWALNSLLSVLISMLPPVYYPIWILPEWLQKIAYAIPTTHVALLVKEAVEITKLTTVERTFNILTLLAWTTVLLTIVVRKSTWREK
ncbi:MAG: ABC transporter permease [Nitrososphaerota archaeon]|nr:ABC transporter permease [Candidatus Geocrenenecus dongiae]